MTFTKNGVSYTVNDEVQADAFRSAGWEEVGVVEKAIPTADTEEVTEKAETKKGRKAK